MMCMRIPQEGPQHMRTTLTSKLKSCISQPTLSNKLFHTIKNSNAAILRNLQGGAFQYRLLLQSSTRASRLLLPLLQNMQMPLLRQIQFVASAGFLRNLHVAETRPHLQRTHPFLQGGLPVLAKRNFVGLPGATPICIPKTNEAE